MVLLKQNQSGAEHAKTASLSKTMQAIVVFLLKQKHACMQSSALFLLKQKHASKNSQQLCFTSSWLKLRTYYTTCTFTLKS
jgi:hypothetical protein